jgi:C-terminal processing protease CtpA/Prc
VMETNSINRGKINWSDFRSQVLARAQGAQSIADAYPAISLALGLLDDHHSFYTAASGSFVGNPSSLRCAAANVPNPMVPADIGYVRIASFAGADSGAVRAFADGVQDQIRGADRENLVGWIVDLRGNTGGNMWPMLAGVGPVLGTGVAGYFFPPNGASSTWAYTNGVAALNGFTQASVSSAYVLIRPSPRVAVLTDSLVASSGEAMAIAFRARPNTRSFGASTCGLSTANGSYRLSDGAMLLLTTALMADRTGMSYGFSIAPDESLPGDAAVVDRAIAWLRAQ